MSELRTVLSSSPHHVVLADDAVDLDLPELEAEVKKHRPAHVFDVRDNIIRIHSLGISA